MGYPSPCPPIKNVGGFASFRIRGEGKRDACGGFGPARRGSFALLRTGSFVSAKGPKTMGVRAWPQKMALSCHPERSEGSAFPGGRLLLESSFVTCRRGAPFSAAILPTNERTPTRTTVLLWLKRLLIILKNTYALFLLTKKFPCLYSASFSCSCSRHAAPEACLAGRTLFI